MIRPQKALYHAGLFEKRQHHVTYERKNQGVDYAEGTEQLIGGSHFALVAEDELASWTV